MNNKTILNPQDLYELNKSELLKKNDFLRIYYADYVNRKKIIVLLEYWLFGLRSLSQQYGIEGVRKFCIDKKTYSYGHFSYLFESDVDIRVGLKPKYSKYIFYILNKLIRKYTGAGAPVNTLFDKIRWRVSKLILLSIPVDYKQKRKSDLIEVLLEILNMKNDLKMRENLEIGLPAIFFSNQNSLNSNISANISMEISPDVLLNFIGLENIFLFDKYITLVGFQHGGGYGSYRVEYFERFERDLADKFFGWGLLKLNTRQHRYFKYIPNHRIADSRFIWIERSKLPNLSKYLFSSTFDHAIDNSAIITIFNAFKESKIAYYNLAYTGMSFCPLYNDYRGLKLHSSGTGEHSLKKNDILIFDTFYSSLIFYCIENNNLFICVTTRKDVDKFTTKNLEWFLILYENNLAFYSDEQEGIKNKLKEINTGNFKVPKKVIEYHNETFINI